MSSGDVTRVVRSEEELSAFDLPQPIRAFLVGRGLPEAVQNFRFGNPLEMHAGADPLLVVGRDGPFASFCTMLIAPFHVLYVRHDTGERTFVNSDLPKAGRCLEIDEELSLAPRAQRNRKYWLGMVRKMRAADPPAFTERGHFWPSVLDEDRYDLGIAESALVKPLPIPRSTEPRVAELATLIRKERARWHATVEGDRIAVHIPVRGGKRVMYLSTAEWDGLRRIVGEAP